jgi:hypothetical protein
MVHLHAPPQSATMPGTIPPMAACITSMASPNSMRREAFVICAHDAVTLE